MAPSLLKSAAIITSGLCPTSKFTAAWKVPSPFPNKTEILFVPRFPTARSRRPSLLKSATVRNNGKLPTVPTG
nr:hypothetical protein [Bacillus wiedmannii]